MKAGGLKGWASDGPLGIEENVRRKRYLILSRHPLTIVGPTSKKQLDRLNISDWEKEEIGKNEKLYR